MARISKMLERNFQDSYPEIGNPEIKMSYDYLIDVKWRRTCLITGKNEPVKWGIYADDWGWYVISSESVLNRDWTEWLISLWIAFGDAIFDGEPTKEARDLAIKHILAEIEYGIRYAIECGSKLK